AVVVNDVLCTPTAVSSARRYPTTARRVRESKPVPVSATPATSNAPGDVIVSRYSAYATVFATVNARSPPRDPDATSVRVSSVVHVAPSFEASNRHERGSRSAPAVVVVRAYPVRARAAGSSTCQLAPAPASATRHAVAGSPSPRETSATWKWLTPGFGAKSTR